MKKIVVPDAYTRRVVKANDLIQNSRFNLTLQQQKIVLYLISQIRPEDKEFKLYEFSIGEFCKVCGIDETSGKNYKDLKAAIKEIADKSLWVETETGEETLLRWIEKPYINKKNGLIKIRLDEDMKPFLLQLKKNFTKYELLWTLHFKSKYTIRLYELVKSIHSYDLVEYKRIFTLDKLRTLLGAENYTTWQTFKARALEPAINEINNYSDKLVSYQVIKKGRSVDKIELTVASRDGLEKLRIAAILENDIETLEDLSAVKAF